MFVAIGFDVSYRTGWASLGIHPDGKMDYISGGVIPSTSTVYHRAQMYREVFTFKEPPQGVAVGIEGVLPHGGNAMYTIEASKRIGEIRLYTFQLGLTNYFENHPSQMRSFVLNARFKGKDEIIRFVNTYLRSMIPGFTRQLDGDEADAGVHALMTAAIMGWIDFPEIWRKNIINKIRLAPTQPLH